MTLREKIFRHYITTVRQFRTWTDVHRYFVIEAMYEKSKEIML